MLSSSQWTDVMVVGAVTAVAMTASWLWQKRTNNAGIVDITWASSLAFAALYYGATGEGGIIPRMLTALMGAMWGFRLANHLLARVLNEGEDGRYKHLRTHWNGHQGKFFLFFQGQTILVLLFSLPFLVAAQNPASDWNVYLVLAILVWGISLTGESVADYQLARFRENPKNRGKTCREGLWRYSRHPNYFFEWMHWFSYCLLCVGAPLGWLSLLGPIAMLGTLVFVTGIPFVEAQSLRSRGEDYRQYQRTTSMLIPWFPKAEARSPEMERE